MTYKLLTILKTSQQEGDNLPTIYKKSSCSQQWLDMCVCVYLRTYICMYVHMYVFMYELHNTFKWD